MLHSTDLLAADTSMGPVTLLVADLDAMTAYYRDAVTLRVIAEAPGRVTLGRGSTELVILEHSPQLKHASPGQAGLFHTAILFDSEAALAAALYSVAQHSPGTFTGSADHLVSKAFYFNDPEGNGIELYWDRDRSQWSWTHGSIDMATLHLDPNQFLQENLTQETVENPEVGSAVVGHVHLSVGDTQTAREFYIDRLGFESTFEMNGSALFVSAGKYHHHMAMNVWNSRGAGRRQATLGLAQIDIVLPTAGDLGALTERMKHFGIDTRDDGKTLAISDPWANLLRVTTAS
ncbi:MAG TPA: VOC family protein [Glaciihabitans sp.]|jgi:catechol 2,3-dioxygenase|nr:VOC family protein [Glaciihabitans sp.]